MQAIQTSGGAAPGRPRGPALRLALQA